MTRAKKPTPAEILTLIADRAESLRKAGVTAVQVDNFSVRLAPWSEPAPTERPGDEDEGPFVDPLQDPATYQRGAVPGFVREPDDEGLA